jgi:alkyl hydroperoxide reductase subunit F
VLIVGGGPAGAAAAVYAARKGIRTGVVAERFGGQTLDTLGIENFISVEGDRGPASSPRRWKPCARLRCGPDHHRPACAALEAGALLGRVRLDSGANSRPAAVMLATGRALA